MSEGWKCQGFPIHGCSHLITLLMPSQTFWILSSSTIGLELAALKHLHHKTHHHSSMVSIPPWWVFQTISSVCVLLLCTFWCGVREATLEDIGYAHCQHMKETELCDIAQSHKPLYNSLDTAVPQVCMWMKTGVHVETVPVCRRWGGGGWHTYMTVHALKLTQRH